MAAMQWGKDSAFPLAQEDDNAWKRRRQKTTTEQQAASSDFGLSDVLRIGKLILAIEFLWLIFWIAVTPYVIVKDLMAEEDVKIYIPDHVLNVLHLSATLALALIIEHYRNHVGNNYPNDVEDNKEEISDYGPLRTGYLASWAIGVLSSITTDSAAIAFFMRELRFMPNSTVEFRLELALAIWALIGSVLVGLWSLWLCWVLLERRAYVNRRKSMSSSAVYHNRSDVE